MGKLTIKAVGVPDPYASLVSTFFAQDFPGATNTNLTATLEALTVALIASNQIRFGPAPLPESLVAIRQVIAKSIEQNRPIPILTPFGSRKCSLHSSVDVAEVAALKQLAYLEQRVKEHYSPGVQVNIRLEDASGHYLFADEGMASRKASQRYCSEFQKLVSLLQLGAFIKPVLESTLFDETAYTTMCDEVVPKLMAYLADTDSFGFNGYENREPWRALVSLGWQGSIPIEQRDYYRNRYRVLYPGISDYDATMKLARYLASSLARIKHNGVGADPSWGSDYIRVTFASPVPGVPKGMFDRTIYYRTIPLKFASTHIPPWRGKGFFKINNETITPKIASWNEKRDYQRCSLLVENNGESVEIGADYIICD